MAAAGARARARAGAAAGIKKNPRLPQVGENPMYRLRYGPFAMTSTLGIILSCFGCSSGGGGPTTLEQVGNYAPPSIAAGSSKPRIGITTLAADDNPSGSMSRATLGETAADEFA